MFDRISRFSRDGFGAILGRWRAMRQREGRGRENWNGRMSGGTRARREGGAGIALLDTRSLAERAPKQNAPPAERRRLSSEKRREFRLRKYV